VSDIVALAHLAMLWYGTPWCSGWRPMAVGQRQRRGAGPARTRFHILQIAFGMAIGSGHPAWRTMRLSGRTAHARSQCRRHLCRVRDLAQARWSIHWGSCDDASRAIINGPRAIVV